MTKTVRGKYIVGPDQVVNDVDEPAFLLAPGGAADAPQLTNQGAISVSGATESGALAAVQVAEGATSAHVFNQAEALIAVSSDVRHQSVFGIEFGSVGFLDNVGEIDATSKGRTVAVGATEALQIQNEGSLIVRSNGGGAGVDFMSAGVLNNTGKIIVTSAHEATTAVGVDFRADASFENSGIIKVVGGDGAEGVLLLGSVSHFVNAGHIYARQLGEGYDTGVQIYTDADGLKVVIDNSGVIDAPFAIHGGDPDGTIVHNEGRLVGSIDFEGSYDQQVFNSGVIHGGVELAGGDDLYDGAGSKTSPDGYIDLGSGNNTGLGGAGSEEMYAGAGTDQLSGRGGDDTLFAGGAADLLSGGKGADHFVYNDVSNSTASASDLIRDLDSSDTIDLSEIDADSHTAGDQAFSLVDHLDGHSAEAALAFDAAAKVTLLQLDVDGDGQADAVILLKGDHEAFTSFIL